MNNIKLNVRGQSFSGWTGVSVEKSLYQMTGTFGLTSTDRFPDDAEKWNIALGDECTVSIDDQIIITGYIEDIPISYDSENHSIQMSGRDKTCDLIDCSFTEKAKEWNKQKIITIIRALCKPFSIDVDVDDSISDLVNAKTTDDTFKINEGETIFDTIVRLCQGSKGVLPVSYGDGKLILTGSGTKNTYDDLELGVNVLSGTIDQSNRDRFQTYIVKAQGKGKDTKALTPTNHPTAQYTDKLIQRHRPIVILLDGLGVVEDCQDRAEWEAVNRAGASRTIRYVVQGWTQSNGDVWPLNSLVQVKDSFLGINGTTWLIAAVNFTANNDAGTTTTLTLTHPETFDLPPVNPTEKMATSYDWIDKLTIQ